MATKVILRTGQIDPTDQTTTADLNHRETRRSIHSAGIAMPPKIIKKIFLKFGTMPVLRIRANCGHINHRLTHTLWEFRIVLNKDANFPAIT